MEIKAKFPEKLSLLFEPYQYKVIYGGRGSGKSWGVARALLIKGVQKRLRILCTREVQKTIDQSVHQTLKDQIELLGLNSEYQVFNTYIRGRNGTEFSFNGLSDETSASLKSFEGVDICWCEEADSITKRSWDILLPTIRKADSEIWVTFNPQLESDETYQRFVKNPPPNCKVVKMNYDDNPWFGETALPAQMEHAKNTLREEDFNHIWLGECKPAVEGAIYFNAMSQMVNDNRIRPVPHDASLKTHVVFDLGFNDAMAIILAQKVASEIRIIHYIEGRQRTLADYSAELRELRLGGQRCNWGKLYLPHDGFSKRHQTGKSDEEVLVALDWSVARVDNIPVKNGIDKAQSMFPRVFIDERCERLIECLKRYRWNISQKTNEGVAPLHDEFSHGADVFRYLALSEHDMTNESWKELEYPDLGII